MSNERVNASVKRDHIALMNKLFRYDEATNTWIAQPEVFFNTPNIAVDMGNFVGALNYWEREQYPDGGITPPVGTGPLARIDATTSEWAKYAAKFLINEEIEALIARTGNAAKVHEVSAFYDVGGIGSMNGRRDGNRHWFFPESGGETEDVNGAADAIIAAKAVAQGKTVPRL